MKGVSSDDAAAAPKQETKQGRRDSNVPGQSGREQPQAQYREQISERQPARLALALRNPPMQLLDLTLRSAAENVALDEALLEQAESAADPRECLRIWESPSPLVVVGRASRVDNEVHRQICQSRGVPILRRTSGGMAIVAGPGCLMYALVLSYARRPTLRALGHAHRLVLGSLVAALRPRLPDVMVAGTSDLAIRGEPTMKFSGNSLRCRRHCLLYHGTLLYDMPLELIGELLKLPPRQPDYRAGRSHAQFVTNVPWTADELRGALIEAWKPSSTRTDWPRHETRHLVAEKYRRSEWNFRL
jgi:lipoate-protein ligase A